jgi:hypothetical protein
MSAMKQLSIRGKRQAVLGTNVTGLVSRLGIFGAFPSSRFLTKPEGNALLRVSPSQRREVLDNLASLPPPENPVAKEFDDLCDQQCRGLYPSGSQVTVVRYVRAIRRAPQRRSALQQGRATALYNLLVSSNYVSERIVKQPFRRWGEAMRTWLRPLVNAILGKVPGITSRLDAATRMAIEADFSFRREPAREARQMSDRAPKSKRTLRSKKKTRSPSGTALVTCLTGQVGQALTYTCNDNYYVDSSGNLVRWSCCGEENQKRTAECHNGSMSFSEHHRVACS